MKVFISQLFHEASSFVPGRVDVDFFKRRHYLKGLEAVKQRFQKDKDWITGVLHHFLNSEDDIGVGLCTACNPAGMIEKQAFLEIIQDSLAEYEDYLKANGPPDVLMLLLHGANIVDGLIDPDAYLVEKFKTAAGHSTNTVVGITLDFHANISETLVSLADIVMVGIEYPHIDTYTRGARAAELSRAKAIKKNNMKSFKFPLPLLTSLPMQATVGELPFAQLVSHVEKVRLKYNLTDLVVAGGYAFGDCFDVGMSVIATDVSKSACSRAYKEVANYIWERKDLLLQPIPSLGDAWDDIEQRASVGRVVVADVADSPGSGGTADETHLLKRLIGADFQFVSAFHVDPEVVKKAYDTGIGESGTFIFGSSLSHSKSALLTVNAKVKTLKDYEYLNVGTMMNGARLNAGPTAVLEVSNGLMVVTTERIQAYDINAFLSIGIDITVQRPLAIAIKSTTHFRASYTALADQGIKLVRCSGWSDVKFSQFHYKYRSKPLLPLDAMNEKDWNSIITKASS